MKRWVTILLLAVVLAAVAQAVEKPYQTGKIVDVQRKVNTWILYYLVNTPITQDDPYYEVSVQLGNTVYHGVHTPMHAKDTLPEEWKAGSEVQVRLDGQHLLVKRPSGVEVDFTIAKRTTVVPATGK